MFIDAAATPIQPVQTERRFLPALAEAITEWFPELNGRALAVSEVTVTKDNLPTLPLVMVAFARSVGQSPLRSHHDEVQIEDSFVVEFWLEPARYKKVNGTETPFWSYYEYESIRDTLLTNLERWQAPGGERVAYRSLLIEADAFAVTLTFGFIAAMTWCAKRHDPGAPFVINFNLCTPVGKCWPELEGTP